MDHILKPDKLDLDPQTPGATATFEYWLTCFEDFLAACAAVVPDDASKLRVLRSRAGPIAFAFIRDSVSYDAAILLLKAQYVKQPNVVFARHLLTIRTQQPGESNSGFLRALRLLARACNFQAVSTVEHSDGMIRDSYVAGLRSPYIRQRLLETADLTLQRAVELADSLDVAIRESAAYLPDPAPATWPAPPATLRLLCLNPKVARRQPSFRRRRCVSFAANRSTLAVRCPARDAICSACSKKGHFAKVCWAKPTTKTAARNMGAMAAAPGAMCTVWAPPSSSPSWIVPAGGKPSTPSLMPLSASGSGPAADSDDAGYADEVDSFIAAMSLDQDHPHGLDNSVAQVQINGHATPYLFDSGSTESFIHPSTVQRYSLQVIPINSRVMLASQSCSATISGCCRVTLTVNGTHFQNFKLMILPNLCAAVLLGLDFQCHLSSLTMQYGGALPPLVIRGRRSQNCPPCPSCHLSTLNISPPSLFANLTPDCKPVATKSRRYSTGDRAFIRTEVQHLLKEGIIEASNSPWRAQVVVVKTGEKNRMVIDYSQTINWYTQLDAYPLPRISDMVNQIAQYWVFSTVDLKSAYHQLPIRPEDRQYTAFEADGRLFHFLRVPFGVTNGVSVFQREMDRMVDQNGLRIPSRTWIMLPSAAMTSRTTTPT